MIARHELAVYIGGLETGSGAERRAEPVDQDRDIPGASFPRPLAQELSREIGHALLSDRILDAPAPKERVERNQGDIVLLREDYQRPVLESNFA